MYPRTGFTTVGADHPQATPYDRLILHDMPVLATANEFVAGEYEACVNRALSYLGGHAFLYSWIFMKRRIMRFLYIRMIWKAVLVSGGEGAEEKNPRARRETYAGDVEVLLADGDVVGQNEHYTCHYGDFSDFLFHRYLWAFECVQFILHRVPRAQDLSNAWVCQSRRSGEQNPVWEGTLSGNSTLWRNFIRRL